MGRSKRGGRRRMWGVGGIRGFSFEVKRVRYVDNFSYEGSRFWKFVCRWVRVIFGMSCVVWVYVFLRVMGKNYKMLGKVVNIDMVLENGELIKER